MFIDRKLRTSLVTSLGLLCNGTETEKRIAWWSESDGSVQSTDESILEEERVISKSRVWPQEWVGNVMCWEDNEVEDNEEHFYSSLKKSNLKLS